MITSAKPRCLDIPMSPSSDCELCGVFKLLPSPFGCPRASGWAFAGSMWTMSACCRCRGEPVIPCTLYIETNCWISTIPPRVTSSTQYDGNRQEVKVGNPRSQEGMFFRPLLPAERAENAAAGAVVSRRVVFDSRCLFEDCRRTDPCNGSRPDEAIFLDRVGKQLYRRGTMSCPLLELGSPVKNRESFSISFLLLAVCPQLLWAQ